MYMNLWTLILIIWTLGLVLLARLEPDGLQSLHLFLAEKAILSFYDVHGIRPDLNDQRLAIIKNNKNQTNNLPHCRPQPFICRMKSLHLLHSQRLDVIELILRNDHHSLNTQTLFWKKNIQSYQLELSQKLKNYIKTKSRVPPVNEINYCLYQAKKLKNSNSWFLQVNKM